MLNKLKFLLFLILAIHITVLAQFAGGSGTEEDPWLIRTPENLDSIRYYTGPDNSDKYFLQTADIDLGVSPWNEGEGWEPIGGNSTEPFECTYNGNGFQINNLIINRPEQDYIGLFGDCSDLNVDNIELININITGRNSVGGLVGESFSATINNSSSTGVIAGASEIGGIVGGGGDGIIIINNSSSTCVISGTSGIGGIVGGGVEVKIYNCYTNVNISGTSVIGGIVGSAQNIFVCSCDIQRSYSIGSVSGDENVGGLSGYENVDAYLSYWNTETSGQVTSVSGEGRTTADMTSPYSDSTYVDWDFENVWSIGYPTKGDYPILKWQIDSSIEVNESVLPNNFTLEQNYPNPFNPSTKISYIIPNRYSDNVKLEIFNTKGELVNTLVNEKQNPGKYSVELNAQYLNSGMYFYTLKTLNSATTKKMILLK